MSGHEGLDKAVQAARVAAEQNARHAQEAADRARRMKLQDEATARDTEAAVRLFVQRVRAAQIPLEEVAVCTSRPKLFGGSKHVWVKKRCWVVRPYDAGTSWTSDTPGIYVLEDGTVLYGRLDWHPHEKWGTPDSSGEWLQMDRDWNQIEKYRLDLQAVLTDIVNGLGVYLAAHNA